MAEQDSRTIFAVFDSFAVADAAARFLKVWEKGDPETKFSGVTLICETVDGQLKVRNYGPRKFIQGAVAGLILGMVAGRLIGLSVGRGILLGSAVGAAAGSLFLQEPELSQEEHAALASDLKGGKAGLVIRLGRGELDDVTEEIVKLDGEVKEYTITGAQAQSLPERAAPVPV